MYMYDPIVLVELFTVLLLEMNDVYIDDIATVK